jgi:hypothetical protein
MNGWSRKSIEMIRLRMICVKFKPLNQRGN